MTGLEIDLVPTEGVASQRPRRRQNLKRGIVHRNEEKKRKERDPEHEKK